MLRGYDGLAGPLRAAANARYGARVALALLAAAAPGPALDNGLARTPPMGWNDFNQYGGSIEPARYKVIADSLVANGLRDLGYVYVNHDGGFPRAGGTAQETEGFVAFAKDLSAYMHSKGMKFGVYMGTTTNPAQTAQWLVDGGCDYLKHDDFGLDAKSPLWAQVRDAIAATKRPIVYMTHAGTETVPPSICHQWRTGPDIDAEWSFIMDDFDQNKAYLDKVGPGAWADPDMLEVGCQSDHGFVLTPDEDRAHFSMWCMVAAPLIAGYDFSQLEVKSTRQHHVQTVAIHANAEVISVDQDSLGKPGQLIRGDKALEVWVKPLKDGSKAVALFNRTGSAASMSVSQADLGWGAAKAVHVRDLWEHKALSDFTGTFSFQVKSHAAEIFKMSTSDIPTPIGQYRKMRRSLEWLARNGYDPFAPRQVREAMLARPSDLRVFDLRGRSLRPSGRGAADGLYILRVDPARSEAMPALWSGGDAVRAR